MTGPRRVTPRGRQFSAQLFRDPVRVVCIEPILVQCIARSEAFMSSESSEGSIRPQETVPEGTSVPDFAAYFFASVWDGSTLQCSLLRKKPEKIAKTRQMNSVKSRVGSKSTTFTGAEQKRLTRKCVTMVKHMGPAKVVKRYEKLADGNETAGRHGQQNIVSAKRIVGSPL